MALTGPVIGEGLLDEELPATEQFRHHDTEEEEEEAACLCSSS